MRVDHRAVLSRGHVFRLQRGRAHAGASRAPRLAVALLLSTTAIASVAADERVRPSVASINLCADQLVLSIADPEQIVTVSWLSADPEDSLLAEQARQHSLNYGSAEELLRFDPDVVIAGAYTNTFTRSLLIRLGYAVIELEPELSVADIAQNVRRVAAALEQPARGDALLAAMRAELRRIENARPVKAVAAVVVRPGGFTVGRESLAHELMTFAGVRNVAAELGLDRWGSLSMETLLRSRPELVITTGYRDDQPSLANAALEHPALARLRRAAAGATVPSAFWACGLPQSVESAALLQAAIAGE